MLLTSVVQACKEWAPAVTLLEQDIVIITHAKINGRATGSVKIYWIIVFIIVRLEKGKKTN